MKHGSSIDSTILKSATLLIISALVGCAGDDVAAKEEEAALVGTWVEIVTTQPANLVDGRQVIERFQDGRFKLIFVNTFENRKPCTGQWSVSQFGRVYKMTFDTIECFSDSIKKPQQNTEFQFELVATELNRLKFKIPAGSPIAPWQARLEGGIE